MKVLQEERVLRARELGKSSVSSVGSQGSSAHDFMSAKIVEGFEDPPVDLSVVVPALNEEGRVGGTVSTIKAVLTRAGMTHEVIVVDDGSSDATSREASEAGAICHRHSERTGKGAAIKTGMAASRGRYVAFIDADLEYPAEALQPMMEVSAKDATRRTCVIAERSKDSRPVWERLSSKIARRLAAAVLRNGVGDTQAGLKLFPGSFARDVLVHAQEDGWMFDVEALLLARAHGLTIAAHPVVQRSVRPRRAGFAQLVGGGIRLVRLAATHDSAIAEAARVVRFALVGGLNTAVDVGTFLLLVAAHPPAKDWLLASAFAILAWATASLVGYALHSRWTFGRTMHLGGFYGFSLGGLAVQTGSVAIATRFLGTGGAIVGKLVGVLLAAGLTYYGFRWLASKGKTLGRSGRLFRGSLREPQGDNNPVR